MKAGELDFVKLSDGTEGTILEVFPSQPESYLFEYATPDGEQEYDQKDIEEEDIVSIIKRS